MNPLISIIIPVYNVEKYLERCVRSVRVQTYRNLEIVLIDDGSPDCCGEMCDNLALQDNRICVYHKTNGGLSDARNFGVEKSHGEWIAFVDSDDYIASNYIEYLYTLLEKNDADISACRMITTTLDNVQFNEHTRGLSESVMTGKTACMELFGTLHVTLVTAWGKLYKRELVEKYPFPVGKKHEDEATTCKYYYEAKKVVLGSEHLYAYYQNPEGIMHTLGADINYDMIWSLEHRALFFESVNEENLTKAA